MFFRRDHRCEGEPRQHGNLQFHLEGAFPALIIPQQVSISGLELYRAPSVVEKCEVRFPSPTKPKSQLGNP